MTAAAASRQNRGVPSACSSTRFAMRKSGSPSMTPPMPLATWSLREGGVVSPANSQKTLPANVYAADSQKPRPAERANP